MPFDQSDEHSWTRLPKSFPPWAEIMQPIFSDYAGIEDWKDLLVEFADAIPDRIASIEASLADENTERLIQLVHQLRGACGSYGFHQITGLASDLEHALRANPQIALHRERVDGFLATLARITVAVD